VTLPPPVRLVGCGSPCGDDAVGWRVIAALRAAVGDESAVELHALATPDGLLDVLDGRGSLVVVDGLMSGAPPGTVQRFAWPDPRLRGAAGPSTHGLSVATVLDVAASLRCLPPRVVVYGVECDGADPAATDMSPLVAAAVPAVVQAILREIAAPTKHSPSDPGAS